MSIHNTSEMLKEQDNASTPSAVVNPTDCSGAGDGGGERGGNTKIKCGGIKKKLPLPRRLLDEDVWFSGSELFTDNSSSDEEGQKVGQHTKKSSSSMKESRQIQKGARKKTKFIEKKFSTSTSTITSDRCDLKSILSTSCSSARTSNSSRIIKKQSQMMELSSKDFNIKCNQEICPIDEKEEEEIQNKKLTINTNETMQDTSTSKAVAGISTTSSTVFTTKTVSTTLAAATDGSEETISTTNEASLIEEVQWRPKRGSLAMPALTAELERFEI